MLFIYNSGIFLYWLAAWISSFFSPKANMFVQGRRDVFRKLKSTINPSERYAWFHFASLGEFEQGRTVLEGLKAKRPELSIIITFFSPSGFEIRKDYAPAAGVFYLPMDTAANAKRFVDLVNPEMAVFTKYDFWFHYFNALRKKVIPLYLISAIFRKDQVFFKWYGSFYGEMLAAVTRFFVQNEESRALLTNIGYDNITISGDTRFDRVLENAANPKTYPEVIAFCKNAKVLICGSTWPADEGLLSALPGKFPGWKFIIAPHELSEDRFGSIEKLFPGSIRFSAISLHKAKKGWMDATEPDKKIYNPVHKPWKLGINPEGGAGSLELGAGSSELGVGSWELGVGSLESGVGSSELGAGRLELGARSLELGVSILNTQYSLLNPQSSILIIDNIGMLSSLYQYGKLAYIGGGFGRGIHNTLEAIAFGLPVIFGPNYEKFQEAKELISSGAAESITDRSSLVNAFERLKDNAHTSDVARNYIHEKAGATRKILDFITARES